MSVSSYSPFFPTIRGLCRLLHTQEVWGVTGPFKAQGRDWLMWARTAFMPDADRDGFYGCCSIRFYAKLRKKKPNWKKIHTDWIAGNLIFLQLMNPNSSFTCKPNFQHSHNPVGERKLRTWLWGPRKENQASPRSKCLNGISHTDIFDLHISASQWFQA